MKAAVSPMVGALVIIVVLAVAGFFLWRGTGGSSKPPMSVGNASPFAPGGVANNKGGKPAQRVPGGGPPGAPRPAGP